MNKKIEDFFRNRHQHRSQITRRILVQYILALAAYAVVFVLCCILAWGIISEIGWAPVRTLRSWIRDHVLAVGLLLFCGGMGVHHLLFSFKADALLGRAGGCGAAAG